MYIIENALIIIPAGIAGLLLALLTGQAIGKGLEINNGFHFYKITAGIIIKSVCSVIAAIVVEELAGLIANQWQKIKAVMLRVRIRKLYLPIWKESSHALSHIILLRQSARD